MLWGWLLVGGIVLLVGLSMAEICSSFPTAGGLYYWAAKLAPGNSAPIWSWFTGWFNLARPGRRHGRHQLRLRLLGVGLPRHRHRTRPTGLSPGHVIAILAVILFVQGLLNTFSIRLVALLNNVSV